MKYLRLCKINMLSEYLLPYGWHQHSISPSERDFAQEKQPHSSCLRGRFSKGLGGQVPMETLALFWLQFMSFSVQDPSTWPLWFTAPGGLWHPLPQQTWPNCSYSSCSSEFLPAPSSALSVLKHLPHVQFSTALDSSKSKRILTGTLQDTSLQTRAIYLSDKFRLASPSCFGIKAV